MGPNEIRHVNNINQRVANGNVGAGVLRDATVDGLLKRMQEMKDILNHVTYRMNDIMSEVLRKMHSEKREVLDNMDAYHDKRRSNKEGVLPEKIFLERNSLLDDLFTISHIRTIYNMFAVTLILLLLDTATQDIIETGTLSIGTTTISKSFEKFSVCLYIWPLMMTTTLGVYSAFNLWAHQRLNFSPKSIFLKIWDYSWLTIFVTYQILFMFFPTKAVVNESLPIGCSAIILMEQVRLIMKCHAFVRGAAPRFLSYKPHTESPKPISPDFSQYLYFLFAPTLVYRDSYPRTKQIRWKFVIQNFLEVGLAIFYYAFIMERFVATAFRDFGKQPLGWEWYLKNILGMAIPAMVLCVAGFYLLLHAWLNAWAEMLRFADRLFYKDWWNCKSYRTYYRTWNVVVHDWLYTYIYKDMYEVVAPRKRVLATTAVFFVSVIVHEYILAFIFRFFYPVMLVLFGGFGFTFVFAKRSAGNIFMWLSLSLGNGILFSVYAIEFYARLNCPPRDNEILDVLLPRSWSCQIGA